MHTITAPEYYEPQQFTDEMPLYVFENHTPATEYQMMHYHNFLEIGYCEKGSGRFVIDGCEHDFTAPCVSVIYPEQIHFAKSDAADPGLWSFAYIDTEKLFKALSSPALKKVRSAICGGRNAVSLLYEDRHADILALVRQLFDEYRAKQPGWLDSIGALCWALLTKHLRTCTDNGDRTELSADIDGVGAIINYINAHYDSELTIGDLTRISNMSESTLNRKFFSFAKTTPMQYLRQVRLDRAASLLLLTSKPITEIAFMTGFSSLSSFNRLFLAHYKTSPSAWRKS